MSSLMLIAVFIKLPLYFVYTIIHTIVKCAFELIFNLEYIKKFEKYAFQTNVFSLKCPLMRDSMMFKFSTLVIPKLKVIDIGN
ncbi:hypothetical protein HCCG_01962 [Helicobacter cinaedi CCUG 18818 = ATCC BAA-847]|uniref:Uncharacterized protein n=1 Tax=Helicobacter cinaedi CCUG 18818 = ATCC BAA-847 TaxID=537971 RepID=A0ABN0BCN1_9HELI|nr:hypothetical protein HCCG_01962 [Helicobacter cinaedi CCUG 18818 = ATCC BAA-847]